MKKLTNPKILIPLIIVLIALGVFATTTINQGGSTPGYSHGHEH